MRRVAVLGDVHGNAVALAAVLEELREEDVDLVMWTGDLTWGWEPAATLELVRSLDLSARYVRCNAERSLLELWDGRVTEPTERERWLLGEHDDEALAFLAAFERTVPIHVEGLGGVLCCHGSPRSDEEILTPETPADRVAAATAGASERIVVSAHTHMQFDREVAGVRSINPGSVGMPYEDRRGAFWALLGPDVEHRRTEYDVDEAVARIEASDDPSRAQMVEILTAPPTRAEVIEHGERLRFSS
jgi:predicted phosphodiesterase